MQYCFSIIMTATWWYRWHPPDKEVQCMANIFITTRLALISLPGYRLLPISLWLFHWNKSSWKAVILMAPPEYALAHFAPCLVPAIQMPPSPGCRNHLRCLNRLLRLIPSLMPLQCTAARYTMHYTMQGRFSLRFREIKCNEMDNNDDKWEGTFFQVFIFHKCETGTNASVETTLMYATFSRLCHCLQIKHTVVFASFIFLYLVSRFFRLCSLFYSLWRLRFSRLQNSSEWKATEKTDNVKMLFLKALSCCGVPETSRWTFNWGTTLHTRPWTVIPALIVGSVFNVCAVSEVLNSSTLITKWRCYLC